MDHRLIRYLLIPLLVVVAVIGAALLFRHNPRFGNIPVANDEKPRVYVQQGHTLSVPCTAWSPDGRYILSGDADGKTILWNARSGREMRNLHLHTGGSVSALAFLPDGKQFLMAGSDSAVRIWDLNTFSEIKRFHAGAPVRAVALSAEGDKLLCTTMAPTAYLWDVRSGRELQRFSTGPGGSWCAALSRDGRYALMEGSRENTLALWELASGRTVREFSVQTGAPLCAAFSADGERIACGSGDRMTFFSMRSWGLGGLYENQDAAGIDVWNAADGMLVCHIEPKNYAVSTVQFEPDGRHLIATAVDSAVSWWDLQNCSLSNQLVSGGTLVLAAPVSSDRKQLVTSGDGDMRVWDIARKEIVRTFTAPAIFDGRAGFSENGDNICTAPQRGGSRNREFADQLFVWDARTGRRVADLDPRPGKLRYSFSDDCRYGFAQLKANKAKAGERQQYFLEFWSLEKGLLGRTPPTVKGRMGSWDFTQDGRYALTNTDDSIYTLWETGNGREVRRIYCADPPNAGKNWITGLDAVSLSDDAQYAVAGRQPAAVLLDFSTGTSKVMHSTRNSTTGIADCRLSADGEQAFFTWWDHTVDVWDISSDKLLHSYEAAGFSGGSGMFGGGMAISRDKSILIATIMPQSQIIIPNDKGKLDTFPAWNFKSLGIWDSRTGKLLREFEGSGGVATIHFSDDERCLITTCMDGGTSVWNKETGKEIVHLVSFENGEWVAVTPEGYYTASINGDAFLNVRTGTKITGIEPYRSTFYQPAVVEAALRLGDSEKAVSEVLGCKNSCTTIADLPEMDPPLVVVKYPDDGDTLHTQDTTLSFHVEDRRNVIQNVKVFVNGRPVRGEKMRSVEEAPSGIQLDIPKDKKALDLEVSVRLDEGDNLITITALGRSEAVDSVHVFLQTGAGLSKQTEIGTVWILAVGVNTYQDKTLRSLRYCANDAQGIVAAFKAQEGKVCRRVMSRVISDAGPLKPTSETILDNLRFLHQAKSEDLAILFLAGHGMKTARGDFYFMPADAEMLNPHDFNPSRAISGAQLQWAVEVPARRFVVVDACQSGDVGVDLVKLAREFKDNRVLILTSSEGNKPSEEADSLKHGLFTYALIKGLKGDADFIGLDGKVTAMELITYVSDKVSTLTQHRQNPVFWAPGGLSDFIVAINSKNPTRMAASIP